ncbi:MAG: transposase [Pseudomonadota bacterium]
MAPRATAEFRAAAVRVALTSGLSRRQVAADFGIGFSTPNNWIRKDRSNPEKPGIQSDLKREIAELRRENRLLREERDVLKKATVFFAERSSLSAFAVQLPTGQ